MEARCREEAQLSGAEPLFCRQVSPFSLDLVLMTNMTNDLKLLLHSRDGLKFDYFGTAACISRRNHRYRRYRTKSLTKCWRRTLSMEVI